MDLLENRDSSFVIDLQSTTSFSLKKLNGQPIPFDEVKMKQYLAYFQNLQYEFLLGNTNSKTLRDSLLNALPYAQLSITDQKGKNRAFDFIRKPSTPEINKRYGINYKFDPDRLYIRFDDNKEVAIIQTYVFGKILQNYSYFLPSDSVKK
jgi:hypothetical protein